MTDLRDFGVVEDPPPPDCHRKAVVAAPTPDKHIAGFVARERAREMTVYTTLRGYSHYYRSGGGFAISESILDLLADHGVSRLYVLDTRGADSPETADVLEFTLREYRDGEEVPEFDLQHPEDPQRYLPEDATRFRWEKLGTDMFASSFQHALDRINARLEPE